MATQLFQAPQGSPAWLHQMVASALDGPKMAMTNLTPELAKELLSDNADNRVIRKVKMAQYAADMRAGNWTLNGEPIIVSKDGKLNDGQHRCLAAIDANASVPVVIMFGIERETRLTVDQGGARTAGDYLGMEGIANADQVAAIARMVMAFERSGGKNLVEAKTITSAEIRERAYADPMLGEAATFGHTNYRYTAKFASSSIVGFAYYILAKRQPIEAKSWLERVCRGDGLSIKDPAYTLREKLRNADKSRDRKIAMILKAWNFHRRGMRVSLNSLNAEMPFPALI